MRQKGSLAAASRDQYNFMHFSHSESLPLGIVLSKGSLIGQRDLEGLRSLANSSLRSQGTLRFHNNSAAASPASEVNEE